MLEKSNVGKIEYLQLMEYVQADASAQYQLEVVRLAPIGIKGVDLDWPLLQKVYLIRDYSSLSLC